MIGNILDSTTELYMIKYAFGEIFSSGGATLCKNPSDQTVIAKQIPDRVSTRLIIFPFPIGRLRDRIEHFGCFIQTRGVVSRLQTGVIRTNCMDCLDR